MQLYTQAIELQPDNAVLYANRAFAHIKIEEYGSAVIDASKAITADPSYAKVGGLTGGLASTACVTGSTCLKGFVMGSTLVATTAQQQLHQTRHTKAPAIAAPLAVLVFNCSLLTAAAGVLPARGCQLHAWQV